MTGHEHSCTAPHHHVDDAADFIAVVERVCRERGLRLTPIRANVLRLIAEAGKPVKAYELLMANGFVHKLSSVNSFVACHHPSSNQHSVPFLICDRCHSAVELEDRDIVRQLENRARELGFKPQAQTLEVHGLCADCAG